MGRKKEPQPPNHPHRHKAELEILKAVAQAWFSRHHYSSTVSSNEFDAHRRNFHGRPTRFRIEAIRKQRMNKAAEDDASGQGSYWDFNQSLWDPYEIVAVSKRLERGLELDEDGDRGGERKVAGKKEMSKHSLRDLIDLFSSRRFNFPFL